MKSRISKEGQIMKLLDLLNVIEDDTPIWIYIDHPFPCKKEGLFFGAVQFAAENDSEWEGYRVGLTFRSCMSLSAGLLVCRLSL